MSASRAAVRKQLATLLGTAAVGNGKPVEVVYDHMVGDFGNASPVVVVTSGPIERIHQGFAPCWHTTMRLWVYVFVLYADQTGTWVEADAEDALDAIEALVADTVLANAHADGYWDQLVYAEEPTTVDAVEVGGASYKREIISVEAEVREN